jgi:Fe2+ or Zn2+ uptake regulation protein
MVNIDFCPFDEYEKYIEAETDFTILNHKFEIIGICPDCKCK